MELKFDKRGHLTPYERNQMEFKEFKNMFVESFDEDSSRHKIFKDYINYLEEFKSAITPNFKQWVNGSFVTNKKNPNDIDFVTLIDHEIAKERYNLLLEKFINKQALKEFNLDAYIVRIFPQDHKEYGKTHSDLLYWEHWFTHSRKNRMKKRLINVHLDDEDDLMISQYQYRKEQLLHKLKESLKDFDILPTDLAA